MGQIRFVVLIVNNEGGQPATIHDTMDAAKDAVRAFLADPENNPLQTEAERLEMESDLSGCDGENVCQIRGSNAWKEWIYIAPIKE